MSSERLAKAPEVATEFESGAEEGYSAEVRALSLVHDYHAPLSMNRGLSEEALAAVGIDRYKYVRVGEDGRFEAVTTEPKEGEEQMTMGFREALRANKGISDDSLKKLGIERDAIVAEIS